jgi:hypothetical protein
MVEFLPTVYKMPQVSSANIEALQNPAPVASFAHISNQQLTAL